MIWARLEGGSRIHHTSMTDNAAQIFIRTSVKTLAVNDMGSCGNKFPGKGSVGVSSGPRGFSLLEILMAVALIGIVFTTVLKMHSQTIAMNQAADFYTVAPLLAQTRLSQLLAAPDRRTDTSGDFGSAFPGYSWSIEITDVDLEAVLGETTDRLERIDVVVSQRSASTFHLRTYCLFPP